MKNIVNKKERNSSIELLRIIAMIMIVFHHFVRHGNFVWDNTSLTLNRFWYNFIFMGGKVGVNIFILISGYFLVNNQKTIFNIKKILKLLGQLLFYSIGIYSIFFALGKTTFEIENIKKVFFPITFETWWFASTYFVLYLMHPFLNKLIHSIDKDLY